MNILLPTDFSENSRNAAHYALQLFQEIRCNFYFLHVLPVKTNELATSVLGMSTEVSSHFKNLLEWLEPLKTNPEHQFHTCFRTGYLIDVVRQKVQEKNIDLILMGTKGKTNRKEAAIGTNTADVMMKVKCSVLAIAENAVFRQHKEILFPTDYKINYGGRMLRTLLNLTNLSKANIRILEIFNSQEEPSTQQLRNREMLRGSFLPKVPVSQTVYLQQKQPPGKVFLANRDIDMIVLAARNLSLCQQFLKKDTKEIPFINQLPLLMLHG